MTNNIAHLQPKVWSFVNRQLIKKAISEFSHELILTPEFILEETDGCIYLITSDNNEFTYQFKAKKYALDHWLVDEKSIIKKNNISNEVYLDALHFITEFQNTLGIPDEFLATYLEEITSILSGAAYKYVNEKFSANSLAEKTFQEIEHAMTEGHPCFVANNGRIGFNIKDYQKYAPESNQSFKLLWIAAHKKYATYTAVKNYEYEKLLESELGKEKLASFKEVVKKQNVATENYIFMPVHPWQWKNKIVAVFGADIAQKNIILVGESDDEFSAQQSIRTLFNASHPEKLYTKTALSILNMGFMRGLSPYYMQSTPHITQWITDLLADDIYLQNNGFTMLGEVATAGYHNHYYETLGKTNPHNKMLSALWRESPFTKISSNQRVFTMAALLHIDYQDKSLLAALIEISPYNTTTWIQRYLKAYLAPLLHCFYKYEFVFMPHGENLILVLEENTPVHVLMKDITEEVIVFNETMHLPEHAKRLFVKTSDKMKVLSIFTDVFDCFFRFMAQQLDCYSSFSEDNFWQLVADCVYEYQEQHPEFSEKYKQYDLFVKEFDRCCLNRLQLSNTKQMLSLANPIESLKLEGVLKNPLARFKKETVKTVQSLESI
ncbi:IucA/IucC family protein [Tenacibaculum mesophilum]|uniref:IucA/IucC family siderophore biosynthesis protein n=1 Tax=Tenacibaculum mesophilum TaxID=104268 RepID=A0ABM7CH83_9FLAO|nr:IucA/IucC family siderophore biosynthesis protein [Tenacibaculum mesophilum]AZJ33139.1 IucA/IucC family siderophore biosynthesis protein [Tenacibaculum mesophilum]QFS28389.1 IucA/IucC family siderophore biosynthesis protein [Tenacibaculum mesophilum]